MKLMTILAAALTIAFIASPAEAKKRHHHHHRASAYHRVMDRLPSHASTEIGGCVSDKSGRTICQGAVNRTSEAPTKARTARQRTAIQSGIASISFGGGSLVSEARSYIGTNPTGRRNLWCGAFMDLVLKKTGHAGGGNLASAYAHYGTRISGPQVGAIAVMARRGGGHVGVVSGIDANGNPIIISGNHNHTTAEAVYPRGRIYAYVVP